MIISRSPMRITLGGGGTDLPSYYEKHEGFVVAGAINKYVFVGANKQFYKNYLLKYSKIELKDKIEEISHPLFRESLRFLSINPGIELTSLSDIPSHTGLGSSGAFLVALINTLYHHTGNSKVDPRMVAKLSCDIEINVLLEHEGKQDKYISAFGGLKAFQFHENGDVSVHPLRNEDIIKNTLEENLYLFYNGTIRNGLASEALKEQDIKTKKGDKNMIDFLHHVKDIGVKSKQALEQRDFDEFARLMDEQWEVKKQYAPSSTNQRINQLHKTALDEGATGGKVIGAPGGGFMLFYHPGLPKSKWNFVERMIKSGLEPVSFEFDTEGVKVI